MGVIYGNLRENPLWELICWNRLRGSFMGILYGDVLKDPLGNLLRGSFMGVVYAAPLWWSSTGILYENTL